MVPLASVKLTAYGLVMFNFRESVRRAYKMSLNVSGILSKKSI